jgi:von Willebrand factor A domain-containing protein 8
MFFTLPTLPMGNNEESALLLSTGCLPEVVQTLIHFASKYRQSLSADAVQKNRRLGTRSLIRIAKRIARSPEEAQSLHELLSRSLLAEFLPAVERMNLDTLLKELKIYRRTPMVSVNARLRFQF